MLSSEGTKLVRCSIRLRDLVDLYAIVPHRHGPLHISNTRLTELFTGHNHVAGTYQSLDCLSDSIIYRVNIAECGFKKKKKSGLLFCYPVWHNSFLLFRNKNVYWTKTVYDHDYIWGYFYEIVCSVFSTHNIKKHIHELFLFRILSMMV